MNPLRLLLRVPVPWVFVLTYLVGVGLERLFPVGLRSPGLSRVSGIGGGIFFATRAALAAWSLRLFRRMRQVWPLVLLPLVLAYVNRTVIPVEEARLTEVFGADYQRYRARVRRWM